MRGLAGRRLSVDLAKCVPLCCLVLARLPRLAAEARGQSSSGRRAARVGAQIDPSGKLGRARPLARPERPESDNLLAPFYLRPAYLAPF